MSDEALALRQMVELFMAERDITATAFGQSALGDPNFVFDLRDGRHPRKKTVKRVLHFILTGERLREPACRTAAE